MILNVYMTHSHVHVHICINTVSDTYIIHSVAVPLFSQHHQQLSPAGCHQGAYFEQMLLLPNVLGEFRSKRPGDGGGSW